VCPFYGGPGSPSNTKSPRLRPTPIPSSILVHPAVWPQRTWAENRGLCPFRGRAAGSPSNTMSLEPRRTSIPSGILIHAAVWHNTNGLKIGASALCPFFGEEKLGPHLGGGGFPSDAKSPWAQAYLHTKWHLNPSSVWPQRTRSENWGSVPLGAGELGPHLTQCGRDRGLPACQVSP